MLPFAQGRFERAGVIHSSSGSGGCTSLVAIAEYGRLTGSMEPIAINQRMPRGAVDSTFSKTGGHDPFYVEGHRYIPAPPFI
jgi:hypothetical protein